MIPRGQPPVTLQERQELSRTNESSYETQPVIPQLLIFISPADL